MRINRHNFLKWKFSVVSLIAVLLVSLNLAFIHSTLIGAFASIVYITATGYILGALFFKEEIAIFKVAIGALLLVILLGLIGAPFAILYRLGAIEVTTILLIAWVFTLLGNTYVLRKASTKKRQNDE